MNEEPARKSPVTLRVQQLAHGEGLPLPAYHSEHAAGLDIVADNTAAAKVVLGSVQVDPGGLDLSLVGVALEVDGEQVAAATGAAVMGHPAAAVALLANWLGSRGRCIEAGWTIFSGSVTAPAPLVAGSHVTATFDHLGTVTVHGV